MARIKCMEENIRKSLFEYFKRRKDDGDTDETWYGISYDDILAWLEKQGKLMKALQISNATIGELIEKNYYLKEQLEKQGKNNMGISEATKQKLENSLNKALEKETSESCNEFLEKKGEQKPYGQRQECADCQFNYAGECKGSCAMKSIDNLTQQEAMDIAVAKCFNEQKPAKQPYSYELEEEIEEWLGCEAFPEGTNITPLPKAMEIVRETANHFYDFGRKQQAIRNIQYTNSQVITPESYINEGKKKGIQIVLDNPQEYGLQKPADKVEPKFNVGDFIVNDYCMGRVVEITNDAYLLDTEQGIPFSCHSTHLWDVTKDAKDGDVLYCKSSGIEYIVMNKGVNEHGNIDSYFRYNSLNGFGVDIPAVLSTRQDDITPATKEQRDQLEKAMTDAGYEWDADKKKLKKIEQNPYGQRQECTDCQFNYVGECKGSCTMKREEQNPAWSEEDERILNCIIEDIVDTIDDSATDAGERSLLEKEVKLLKSLKDRYAWKPSDEQMRVLDLAIRCGIYRGTTEETTLISLFNDLKKLKG